MFGLFSCITQSTYGKYRGEGFKWSIVDPRFSVLKLVMEVVIPK